MNVTHLLYCLVVALYWVHPSPFLKSVPLFLLAVDNSNVLVQFAFCMAGLGDILLDGDQYVLYGTICFMLTNLALGLAFLQENLTTYPDDWHYQLFFNRVDAVLWIIWAIIAGFMISQVGENAHLFTAYSLFLLFSVSQSYKLVRAKMTRYAITLFMISDILVLTQYLPLNKVYDPYIHVIGLILYWSGMAGIDITFSA
jgi:uncharacterized membrane protein YhhN